MKGVRLHIQQCGEVMRQSLLLTDAYGGERTRRRPPQVKSQELLARLFKRCVADLVQSGDPLFALAKSRLEALRERHEQLVSASRDLWRGGYIPNQEHWDAAAAANAAWESVDQLVEGVEKKLHIDDAATKPSNQAPLSADRIAFDVLTTTITLDGVPHQMKDPAAYGIVKFLHDKAGEIIKSPVIQSKVPGLGGRNAVGEKIKKLPKAIRACVHGICGQGFHFSMPRQRTRKR